MHKFRSLRKRKNTQIAYNFFFACLLPCRHTFPPEAENEATKLRKPFAFKLLKLMHTVQASIQRTVLHKRRVASLPEILGFTQCAAFSPEGSCAIPGSVSNFK